MIKSTAVNVKSGLEKSPRQVLARFHARGGVMGECGAKVPGHLRSYFVTIIDEIGAVDAEYIIRVSKQY